MDKLPFNTIQKKTETTHESKEIQQPPINYISVVIDDAYIQKNLLPNGALRMKGGEANWNGQVDLMRYSAADTLSPEYRQMVLEKIDKLHATQERTYQHESHHIRNRENKLTPHVAAGNVREFLTFRVLDELSAFTAGELYSQEVTADTIIDSLKIAEQKVADSYYGQPFITEGKWYVDSKGASNPNIFSRDIGTEKYHQIMRQYFTITGTDTLAILQQAGKMSEFTTIVNGLIMKLDPLLDQLKSKQ